VQRFAKKHASIPCRAVAALYLLLCTACGYIDASKQGLVAFLASDKPTQSGRAHSYPSGTIYLSPEGIGLRVERAYASIDTLDARDDAWQVIGELTPSSARELRELLGDLSQPVAVMYDHRLLGYYSYIDLTSANIVSLRPQEGSPWTESLAQRLAARILHAPRN